MTWHPQIDWINISKLKLLKQSIKFRQRTAEAFVRNVIEKLVLHIWWHYESLLHSAKALLLFWVDWIKALQQQTNSRMHFFSNRFWVLSSYWLCNISCVLTPCRNFKLPTIELKVFSSVHFDHSIIKIKDQVAYFSSLHFFNIINMSTRWRRSLNFPQVKFRHRKIFIISVRLCEVFLGAWFHKDS